MNTLAFRGAVIRDRNEHLCLTDMWKAAGSPEGKRPDDWKKDANNRGFLDHIAMAVNAPVEGIWNGQRGRAGGTWAHWQVGLAYAKYLNHDFHMWVNEVVRAHMEGRAAGARHDDRLAPLEAALLALAEKVAELSKMADPRLAVAEFTSMREVLDRAGARPKGRRSLQGRLSRAFHDRARLAGVALRRNPHSAQHQWLFPVEFVKGCMAEFGAVWVAEHNEAIGRQGILPFTKPKVVRPSEEARI